MIAGGGIGLRVSRVRRHYINAASISSAASPPNLREHVPVGVEGYRNGAVPEELLHKLRVDVSREKERRASVTHMVERDPPPCETGALQESSPSLEVCLGSWTSQNFRRAFSPSDVCCLPIG